MKKGVGSIGRRLAHKRFSHDLRSLKLPLPWKKVWALELEKCNFRYVRKESWKVEIIRPEIVVQLKNKNKKKDFVFLPRLNDVKGSCTVRPKGPLSGKNTRIAHETTAKTRIITREEQPPYDMILDTMIWYDTKYMICIYKLHTWLAK